MHIRLLHAGVNSAVFLFALLDVPARQTVFDLAVRPRVLFKHGDSNSVVGQNFRRYGTRNRTANYADEMMPRIRHSYATPCACERDCTTQSRKVSPAAEDVWSGIFGER